MFMDLINKYSLNMYAVTGGFQVLIRYDDSTIEAFITHRAYGAMDYMFGVSLMESTVEQFTELVEENLYQYMENYAVKHMGA